MRSVQTYSNFEYLPHLCADYDLTPTLILLFGVSPALPQKPPSFIWGMAVKQISGIESHEAIGFSPHTGI
jgi:hypothetical protein